MDFSFNALFEDFNSNSSKTFSFENSLLEASKYSFFDFKVSNSFENKSNYF